MVRARRLAFVGVIGFEVDVLVFGPQASKSVNEEEVDRGFRLTVLRATSGAK